MTDANPMKPDDDLDATLVALVHGELAGDERQQALARLQDDPTAREKLAVLEATDALLGEALERDAAPRPTPSGIGVLRPLLALAALLAVVAVFVWPPSERGDEASGKEPGPPAADNQVGNHDAPTIDQQQPGIDNEHFHLDIAPRGGAESPLFSDAAIELHWHNKSDHDPRRPIRVMPLPFGETHDGVSKAVDRGTHIGTLRMAVLPVVLRAKITPPAGEPFEARWAPADGKFFQVRDERKKQVVRLRDFEVQYAGIRPRLVGGPTRTGWRADGNWGATHLPRSRTMRWFPELPGEYRIELSVESIPAPSYMPWPTWDEAPVTDTAIVMAGSVSDWGEAHQGLRARLVWSRSPDSADQTPFALQIENVGTTAKKYNYAGSTIAKIPQPLHFTLVVDGVEWQQRQRIPIMISALDSFQPHPAGVRRSLVVHPDYWRNDGKKLSELPGKHRVRILFHSKPSVWNAADTSIWHGKLNTPEIEIEVRK
ncbi:MAG: hypothetical protein NXI31_03210 [bacterium]|nr:hypothetical protein [bacterium]